MIIMSMVSTQKINCEKCGRELKVNIYDSINVSLDYKLKEKLLNGELTKVCCDCGHSFMLKYPILYHKMNLNNSVMIQYTKSDAEEVKKQHQFAKLFMQSYFPENTLQTLLKKTLYEEGVDSEDIFEVYDDWDKFIERIKEIG